MNFYLYFDEQVIIVAIQYYMDIYMSIIKNSIKL